STTSTRSTSPTASSALARSPMPGACTKRVHRLIRRWCSSVAPTASSCASTTTAGGWSVRSGTTSGKACASISGETHRRWSSGSGSRRGRFVPATIVTRPRGRVRQMLDVSFDNAFVRELPGDPEAGARIRQVEGALWSRVTPTPVQAPRVLAYSREMAAELGLDEADVQSPEFARVFGGNALLPGMEPYAVNYGGHQFGHWAGQLGDGRAITLGETVSANGRRWELQLKGAGLTPYSRTADGRAVLRSSIREFLCSEAMHHLGVPTTRALSLVGTGEMVVRDMFYDGHPKSEPGAIVCRVAPSFLRFGNFELPYSRGDLLLLRQLLEFCIRRDFPELEGEGEQLYATWFGEVCVRTAVMIA